MTSIPPLSQLMKAEFALAKRWLRADAVLRWIVAGTAIYAILTEEPTALVVVLVGFVGPLLAVGARELGTHHYAKGERLRRLYLLQQGLGLEPTETEILESLSDSSQHRAAEPEPKGGYYTSDLPKSYPRLLHLVQESAFWTRAQARFTMRVHYVVFAVGLTAAIVIAFLALPRAGTTVVSPLDYPKLFATLLLFFVSGATLQTARAYQALARGAGAAMEAAANLRKTTPIEPVALYKVLGGYDAALAKGLPLPGYSYSLQQDALNKAWSAVVARDSVTPP